MAIRKTSRTLIVLAALLAASMPVLIAQPLVTIRATSLDAVLSDMEAVSAAVGTPLTRAQALEPVQKLLQLETLEGIDFTRPVVVVLPVEGMLMPAQGLVGAIPVGDSAAMVAALREKFPDGAAEGLIQEFAIGEGMSLFIQPADGYLMVAANRQIAEDAVLNDLLAADGLPPGSLGVRVQLEPVMPMIQMGLMQGRQALAAEFGGDEETAEGQAQDETGGTGTQGEAGEAGDGPTPEQRRATAVAMNPMLDTYFSTVSNVLANISSISISFERDGESLMMHDWVVPRAGSTFAELLAGQTDDWPAAARVIDAQDAAVTGAANVTLTPRMRTAMAQFSKKHFETIGGLGTLTSPGPGSLGWLTGLSGTAGPMTEMALRCLRGDMGLSMKLDGEKGLSIERAVGLNADPECAGLAGAWGKMLEGDGAKGAGQPPIEFQADAVQHRGVSASRVSIRLTGEGSVEAASRAIGKLYGGESLDVFEGTAGDLQLTAAGAGAEDRFRGLVDRQAGGIRGDLRAEDFAPLNPAPGMAIRVDVPLLARGVLELFGDQDEELGSLLSHFASAEHLEVLYGVKLDASRSEFMLDVPMELLRIIGRIEQQEKQQHDSAMPADHPQQVTPAGQDG